MTKINSGEENSRAAAAISAAVKKWISMGDSLHVVVSAGKTWSRCWCVEIYLYGGGARIYGGGLSRKEALRSLYADIVKCLDKYPKRFSPEVRRRLKKCPGPKHFLVFDMPPEIDLG